MEEKEMTKIFLKTLGAFYYEIMVASVPSDFTEMVGMGVHLEEAVREGRLTRRVNPPRRNHQRHQYVASITPVFNTAPTIIAYQRPAPQGNQGQN